MGRRLFCAKARMKSMGFIEMYEKNDIIIQDPHFDGRKIGKTLKPNQTKCLPRCRAQENEKKITSASYPQNNLFFYQKTFCDVASILWQRSCKIPSRHRESHIISFPRT